MNPGTSIQFVADLSHVREVSLVGTADLAFWKDWLTREHLVPIESDGKAQFLIVAAEGKFRGLRFRELSFSVRVVPVGEETRPEGCYLVHAFNSSRLFAFCERLFFSTPYYHGDVRISTPFPPWIRLTKAGQVVFEV